MTNLRATFMVLVMAAFLGAGTLQAQTTVTDIDPRIQALLASISEERLQTLLTRLTSFGTRNTLSNATSPTRGVGAARQWIFDELTRASPKLQVSFDTHMLPRGGRVTKETELRNVLAILPGRSPRRIYVSGHYDSLNLGPQGQSGLNTGTTSNTPSPAQAGLTPGSGPAPVDPDADAPGANDDGSGTVLVMELARVFATSGIDFDATLVFITVAGEEQGLVGSRAHARRLKADGVPVQAFFNNDIVGGIRGGDGATDTASIRVYSEGPEDSPSRALAQFTRRVAARYVPSHRVRLLARRDRFARGGDHTSYNLEGFTAIGFRESKENYSKQHNANDTLDGVSYTYIAQNARVNAAAMATLALAPPPPVIVDARGTSTIDRQPTGYNARLRWSASPGATGYRIFWREAWAPDWQQEIAVGNRTDYVFPQMNIDDYVFGVAAIDAAGHESTIATYIMPPASAAPAPPVPANP